MESIMYFQEPTDQDHPYAAASVNHRIPAPETCSARASGKRERPVPLHRGFTKLPLPATSPVNSAVHPPSYPSPAFPPLRRCSSDPVPLLPNPPQPLENASAGGSATLATPSPSPARMGSSTTRGLCRSVSAPENELIAATDRSGESPNSKRLKMMKDRMKEMSQWCDQVITEVDEEDEDEGEDHLVGAEVLNHEAPKDDDCECSETEEAVSVEKKGECLIIHMKCPCSKAYQFLLSGNNCYYKLM